MDYLTEQHIMSLLEDLKKVNARLKEIYQLERTQVHQDAAIKRFEFTFELSWKLMQEMNVYLGKSSVGPKPSIRTAAEKEVIADPETWLQFLEARNLTSHTYKQPLAEEVFQKAKNFPPLVDALIASAEQILAPEQ